MKTMLGRQRQQKQTADFFVSPPQPLTVPATQKIVSWQVIVQFLSKDDAEDFIEDMALLKNPEIQKSFKRSAKESIERKARPIEELFKEYGI